MSGIAQQDMNKQALFSWLLNQSPAIIVLVCLAVFLGKQNERFIEENKACNQEIVRVYQIQNDRMIRALENIEYYVQSQSQKLPSKK